ncbi:RidA family protein [Jeotgalicoccus sp. ATCC 8456]|uniref:RidA family protein n=1 Tax=Jeotgalicoccus sp. ATCC 8456 TaxID=946435 RepID=UPI0018E6086C|nr:RidA family protein [Jeotgalicoccus sp. ATCC 8456]QQD85060.1 RidA family protein [Jeotgalicoccus sp. ATCC 8456]
MSELNKPVPQGNYKPASRFKNIISTAGMTPRKNGELIQSGRILHTESIESYREAILQAIDNAYSAAMALVSDDEVVKQVLSMTVYVNADDDFTSHSKVADIGSDYLFNNLGQAGIGSRAAIGVKSLPGNAPVEIQLVIGVGK